MKSSIEALPKNSIVGGVSDADFTFHYNKLWSGEAQSRSETAPTDLWGKAQHRASSNQHPVSAIFQNSHACRDVVPPEKTRPADAPLRADPTTFAPRNWDPYGCVQKSKTPQQANRRRAEHNLSRLNFA
jgi:hypothetical protein